MAPFGFISDGLDENTFVDSDGDRWYIDKDGIQGLARLKEGPGSWNVDEYGDRSYMWDYM